MSSPNIVLVRIDNRLIHKTVSVDKEDIAAFWELADMGIDCSIQTVPQKPHVYMRDVL